MDEHARFVNIIVWSHEATFKLSGTVNRHNCVYWSSENPNIHVEKAAIPTDTLVNVCHSVVRHYHQCQEAGGGQFEHL